jgi:hypothetical protein
MRLIVFALVSLMLAAPGAGAQQHRTIVGVWKLPGQGCARADGALTIGALSLEGEDVTCRFTNVSRNGATVTWTGDCGSGPETVVATEANERLTIRYVRGGNVVEGLTRCPARR